MVHLADNKFDGSPIKSKHSKMGSMSSQPGTGNDFSTPIRHKNSAMRSIGDARDMISYTNTSDRVSVKKNKTNIISSKPQFSVGKKFNVRKFKEVFVKNEHGTFDQGNPISKEPHSGMLPKNEAVLNSR